MFVLFSMIFVLLLTWLSPAVVMFFKVYIHQSEELVYIYGAYILFYILTLLPNLAVTVRRLHDVGKSGLMFFISLIPVIGTIWVFVLLVRNGQTGENKYGLDPKTSEETDLLSKYPKTRILINAANTFLNVVIILIAVIVICVLSYFIIELVNDGVLPAPLLITALIGLPISVFVYTNYIKENKE